MDTLIGNPGKAIKKLGWNPSKTSFDGLISMMVDSDKVLLSIENKDRMDIGRIREIPRLQSVEPGGDDVNDDPAKVKQNIPEGRQSRTHSRKPSTFHIGIEKASKPLMIRKLTQLDQTSPPVTSCTNASR